MARAQRSRSGPVSEETDTGEQEGFPMESQPKRRYRASNPEYSKSLEQRGGFDLFISEETLEHWHAPAEGHEGHPRIYRALLHNSHSLINANHPYMIS